MTPLRQRMLEDMQMRNLSRGTQMIYVRAVMHLARHFQKPPDQLQHEEVRSYLVYLAQQRRVAPTTYNQTRCALKFFYEVTLGQEWVIDRIVCQKTEKHLPVILSQSEVVRFCGAQKPPVCRSTTSTVNAWSFACVKAKGRRIVM